MYIKPKFVTGRIYHVYNRGVAKQIIFHDTQDYLHYLSTLNFYLEKHPKTKFSATSKIKRLNIFSNEPKNPLVEILAYCLMPNHFHLLLKQVSDEGITTFIRRSSNSYTRAYNTRYDRIGTIYQGRFSAVSVKNDEQLLHLSRYIHLNPYVANICEKPEDYIWSSYNTHYLKKISDRLCHSNFIMSIIGSKKKYQEFINEYSDYALNLATIKKQLIDI